MIAASTGPMVYLLAPVLNGGGAIAELFLLTPSVHRVEALARHAAAEGPAGAVPVLPVPDLTGLVVVRVSDLPKERHVIHAVGELWIRVGQRVAVPVVTSFDRLGSETLSIGDG